MDTIIAKYAMRMADDELRAYQEALAESDSRRAELTLEVIDLKEENKRLREINKNLGDAVQHYEHYCLPELMEASVLMRERNEAIEVAERALDRLLGEFISKKTCGRHGVLYADNCPICCDEEIIRTIKERNK